MSGMSESEFKKIFKDSVKHYGGLAISLSASFNPGLPDLYVLMPGCLPVMMEAKFLKKVNDKFSRKLKYSPLQKKFLYDSNAIQANSSIGLVGFKYKGQLRACLINHRIDTIDQDFASYCSTDTLVGRNKIFNIPMMFMKANLYNVSPNTYAIGNPGMAVQIYTPQAGTTGSPGEGIR